MTRFRRPAALLLIGASVLAVACQSGNADDVLEAIELRAEGFEANERGDWRAAIDAYSRAIELDPGVASDHAERAFASGHLGNADAAIEDLTEAIRLDPDAPAGYNQRALYYNEQQRWSEAVADLDRAIELRPGRADQHNGRGLAHLNLGNSKLAIGDFTTALGLDPDSPQAPIWLSNRASGHSQLNDHEAAIEDYDRSLALDPQNAQTVANRAAALFQAGDIEGAIAGLETALQLANDPRLRATIEAALATLKSGAGGT